MSLKKYLIDTNISYEDRIKDFRNIELVRDRKLGMCTLENSNDFYAGYFGIKSNNNAESFIMQRYSNNEEDLKNITYTQGDSIFCIDADSVEGQETIFRGVSFKGADNSLRELSPEDSKSLYFEKVEYIVDSYDFEPAASEEQSVQ